jgi:hypothetical protein
LDSPKKNFTPELFLVAKPGVYKFLGRGREWLQKSVLLEEQYKQVDVV